MKNSRGYLDNFDIDSRRHVTRQTKRRLIDGEYSGGGEVQFQRDK